MNTSTFANRAVAMSNAALLVAIVVSTACTCSCALAVVGVLFSESREMCRGGVEGRESSKHDHHLRVLMG